VTQTNDARSHDRYLELAATAIDFPLSPAEGRELQAHLATCERCAMAAIAIRRDATGMSQLRRQDAPLAIRDAVTRAATSGRGIGRPSPGPLLGIALLVLAVAGSAFVAGSLLDRRSVPDATMPATVERASPAPRATDRREGHPTDWLALGDITSQLDSGAPSLLAAGPHRGFTAFGLDGKATTPVVWSSEDGRRWRRIASPVDAFGAGVPTSAVVLGDHLIVVGRELRTAGQQKAAWSSADGRTWHRIPGLTSRIATRRETVTLSAGPLGVLAWTPSGRAWWSTDGSAWERVQIGRDAVADVAVGPERVVAIGRAANGSWIATSRDGSSWPAGSRSELDGTGSLGVETSPGDDELAWVGRTRYRASRGAWAPDDARLPAPLPAATVVGGPAGFAAVGGLDPATGAHHAWVTLDDGTWKAIEGSTSSMPDARPGVAIVGIVPDGRGWLVVARDGARFTSWRIGS
jgi:hypothetical protein